MAVGDGVKEEAVEEQVLLEEEDEMEDMVV